MKFLMISITLFGGLANSQYLPLPDLDSSWLEDRRKLLASLPTMSKNERIDKLAPLAGMGGFVSNPTRLDPLRYEIFRAAQQALLAESGYGDHLAKRLTEGRDRIDQLKAERDIGELNRAWISFNSEQNGVCRTLSQLPGPETVRVLGEMLNDERGRYANADEAYENGTQETAEVSNSSIALRALRKLSLVSKPALSETRRYEDYESDRHSWLLWYAQVKAGNRTFRFEGDPQEYNLNGPVNRPSHYRSNRTSLAANSPAHGVGQQSAVSSIPKALPIVATLVGLLAGWLAWRSGRLARAAR